MNESLKNYISRMIISLLILLQACGVSPLQTSSPEDMGYRYDDLPVPGNESAAFAEYQAISKRGAGWILPIISSTIRKNWMGVPNGSWSGRRSIYGPPRLRLPLRK